MKKVDAIQPTILSETDKREFCHQHGWVGRSAFQRDRHDLCEAPAEAAEEYTDDDDIDNDDEPKEEPIRWSRASARQRGIPPKRTVAIRRITQLELQAGRDELRKLDADGPYDRDRPKTRGDCARVPRPCPYITCKHSLYLDVNSETGSIILNFPHLEPGQMPADQSCSLDLADNGAMTLDEIAIVTNLTRERIRQVELKALSKRARPAAEALGLSSNDADAVAMRRTVGPGADIAEAGVDGEVPSDVATMLSGRPLR